MFNNQNDNEWQLRKRLRLEQVRLQSKQFAHQLRNKVSNEQKEKLKQIENVKQEELNNFKRKTLNELNQEYRDCLANIGAAHRAAFCETEKTRETVLKPIQRSNICFEQKPDGKLEKLLSALVVPRGGVSQKPPNVSKPKGSKSKKVENQPAKPRAKLQKDIETQTEEATVPTSTQQQIDLDERDVTELFVNQIPEASSRIVQDNKENEQVTEVQVSKPHFSQISDLVKQRKSSRLSINVAEAAPKSAIIVPLPPIEEEDNLNRRPSVVSFKAVKDAISAQMEVSRKPSAASMQDSTYERINSMATRDTAGEVFRKLSASNVAATEVFRKPSDTRHPSDTRNPSDTRKPVDTRKPSDTRKPLGTRDAHGQMFREPSASSVAPSETSRKLNTTGDKVQMYDNRTKFGKEYVPDQQLTHRTVTNQDSPNAMELAAEENERMRIYSDKVDERLKRDMERGENAIEREKLTRKYKNLLAELDKLSTEEKTLKNFIQAHQPPQHEPKMPNMREFMEKRTIITTAECKRAAAKYINVASIRSSSSSRSEDSRKSIILDYEESVILENLSESNLNVDAINRIAEKTSPMVSAKSTKDTTQAGQGSAREGVVQTVRMPSVDSNGRKIFDAPIKITIQIQPSDREEVVVMDTSNEMNLKLSQLESVSSSVTEYRSLPKTLTRSSEPTMGITKTMSKSDEKGQIRSAERSKQTVSQEELGGYIQQLLQMSKQSIDDLPVNVSDVESIRDSIVDTTSNGDVINHAEVTVDQKHEKTTQYEYPNKNISSRSNVESDLSSIYKYSSIESETSSTSLAKPLKTSLRKSTSYSLLSQSSNTNDPNRSKQFIDLAESCNERITKLTDLVSKVRSERQQILEGTSLTNGKLPNNSTEYYDLPNRLLNLKNKLPSPPPFQLSQSQRSDELYKKLHELSTILETGNSNAPSKFEKSETFDVDKIITEVFSKSSTEPNVDFVPFQKPDDEPTPEVNPPEETTLTRNDSELSLLDVFTELNRRNILPDGLKKSAMEHESQSMKTLNEPNESEVLHASAVATETLNLSSTPIQFNRRSLLAHSTSSNDASKSTSSSSSLSNPLNLKQFLERELTKYNSSSESSASKRPEGDSKAHRTSTPVTKHSSSKSPCISLDAQSNLFSGESQISSVKSNTTSTWDSA